MLVDIHPHEKDAMEQIVRNVRVFAELLNKDREHSARLTNWAQMLEDIVERMDAAVPQ